jgi:sugar phosphate isomerase/epimerase
MGLVINRLIHTRLGAKIMKNNILFDTVSLVSNIAKGYTLPQALRIIADCGFEYAEIASIGGMCEHIAAREITPDYIGAVKEMLINENLKCHAFSGHVDLTLENEAGDFLKKMELASAIGCKVINTNSGPAAGMDSFRRHLRKVIDKAEKLGLTVCLESHGDIIGTAKQAVGLFREINHPLIRMNYDTGNTYFYEKGRVSVEEDVLYGLEYLAYVHVKDIHIDGNFAYYRPLGGGDIKLTNFFAALGQLGRPLPCGVEVPVFVSGPLSQLSSSAAPIGVNEIRDAAYRSIEYMKHAGVIT